MASNTSCKFDCDENLNCANWNPVARLDKLIQSIENETDMTKIAKVADECLHLLSLMDTCNFMVRHKYEITPTNVDKFKEIAIKSYFIRLEIMKELMLQ